MHLGFRRWLTFLLLSVCVLSAHATRYQITTTEDRVAADGHCSLREAFQAINERTGVHECEAGESRGNRIRLETGAIYELDPALGQLTLGATNDQGDPVPRRASITTNDLSGDGDNSVVDINSNSRAFQVQPQGELTLSDITVRNGDAGANAGGLIHVDGGALDLVSGSRLDTGVAGAQGGLLYAKDASVSLQQNTELVNGQASGSGGAVFLEGGSSLTGNNVSISGSSSDDKGGGIALDTGFSGIVSLENAYLGGNHALQEGGGLYFQGDSVVLILSNTTIANGRADNGAGGLHFASTANNQLVAMNNVTFANNISDSASGSVFIADGDADDSITNSVIVGDLSGNDCAPGSELDDADDPTDTIFLGWNVLGTNCTNTDNGTANEPAGSPSKQALANHQGPCNNTENNASPGCEPAPLDPYPGYFPAADGPAFGSGSPSEQSENSCIAEDQRGASRLEEERCDSGSIQFVTAVGQEDELNIISGETTELDVAENDLGDATLDCSRVGGIQDCIELVFPPDRPEASVRFELVDKDGDPTTGNADGEEYPKAIYDPGSDYHGLDRFAYSIDSGAFEATRQGRAVEDETNVVAQPDSGLEESSSIEHLGSLSGFALMIAGFAGFLRRRGLPTVALLLLVSGTQAAEIRVTDSPEGRLDNMNRGDGVCTLREAIYSSRDDTINREPACEDGADGGDTVIVPRGCITLDGDLGPLQVLDRLTIRGEGAHGIDPAIRAEDDNNYDPGEGLSGNECAPNNDSNPDWTEGTIIRFDPSDTQRTRILENSKSMTLEDLSLMYGQASGNNGGAIRASADLGIQRVEFYGNEASGAGSSGGAIFLVGISDPTTEQSVVVRRSYFFENTANNNGGAIAMQGGTGYALEVIDSTFEANEAINGAGGAIRMVSNRGGSWVVNTTLVNNSAAMGAGGIDLKEVIGTSDAPTPSVNMVNNTIVDNQGGGDAAGVDLGEEILVDGQPARRIRLNNSVVAGNTPGNDCSSAATPQPFHQFIYNLLPDGPDMNMTTCVGSEDDHDNQNESDIRDSLAASTAYTDGGEADDFVPPNIRTDPAGSASIQDSANDDDVASSDTDTASACRARDVRGFTRPSGPRCDRGAFEIQETTAQDDAASDQHQDGSQFLLPVLDNDSTDPTQYEIDPTSIRPTGVQSLPGPSSGTPGTALVYKAFPSVECGTQGPDLEQAKQDNPQVDFDPDDFECAVLYDPVKQDPLDDNSAENNIDCTNDGLPIEFTEDEWGEAFRYEFDAVDENDNPSTDSPSNAANVYLTIRNRAPSIQPKTVWNEKGETRVIKLDIQDSFGGEIDYSSLSLSGDPQLADTDENGDVVGTGIKLNEPEDGYITYVPRDQTKTFTDRFSVKISDTCEDTSTGATIVIRYPEEDVGGGELLQSGGVSGWALVLLSGLGGLRRRLRAAAPRHR